MRSLRSFFQFSVAIIVLACLLIASACSLRKHIPKDKVLVSKVRLKGEPAGTEESLYPLIRQHPNYRFLSFTFRVNMWNYLLAPREKIRAKRLSKIQKKENQLAQYRTQLRELGDAESKKKEKLEYRIGRLENEIQDDQAKVDKPKKAWEEPVLFDSILTATSVEQMRAYLFNKGYFNAKVEYQIKDKVGPRIRVTYRVHPGDPYKIARVDYSIEDSALAKYIQNDTSESLIKPGKQYDGDVMAAERERITVLLRDQGYYNFSREYIYYQIDSTLPGNEVSIGLQIANPQNRDHHRLYKLNNIYVEPEYFLGDTTVKDTFVYYDLKFLSTRLTIRPRIISDFIFFKKGQLYKYSDYRSTLTRLSQLNLYRFIDIQFSYDTTARGRDTGLLNCMIRLTPLTKQEYQGDLELNTREQAQGTITQSTRSMGTAASFMYRNKNLARSALQLEIRPRLALDFPINLDSGIQVQPSIEYGLSTALIFPQLLVPFYKPDQWLRLASQTSFNANYLFESNRDFKRSTLNANMLYQVKLSRERRVYINPFDISLVDTRNISDTVRKKLAEPQNAVIRNLFDQHIVTGLRGSFTKNQQPLTMVKKHTYFLRISHEMGGLAPYIADKIAEDIDPGSSGTTPDFFNINYYKYTRTEADLRVYLPVLHDNNFAWRITGGLGIPLFMQVLPFERRFYVGGSNSLRAWHIRELGPGGYHDPDPNAPHINTGDIRLETNAELRFPVYGLLKGALFMDAGNVWTLKDTSIKEGVFKADSVLSQTAVALGLGARLDFSFFVVRLDLALPAHLPYGPMEDRFVLNNYGSGRWLLDEVNLNVGIGYPF